MDNVVTGPVFLHSCLSKPDVLNLDENCSIGNLPLFPLSRHSNSLVRLSLSRPSLPLRTSSSRSHNTRTQTHNCVCVCVCVCVFVGTSQSSLNIHGLCSGFYMCQWWNMACITLQVSDKSRFVPGVWINAVPLNNSLSVLNMQDSET